MTLQAASTASVASGIRSITRSSARGALRNSLNVFPGSDHRHGHTDTLAEFCLGQAGASAHAARPDGRCFDCLSLIFRDLAGNSGFGGRVDSDPIGTRLYPVPSAVRASASDRAVPLKSCLNLPHTVFLRGNLPRARR